MRLPIALMVMYAHTVTSLAPRCPGVPSEERSSRRRRHLVFPRGSFLTVSIAAGAFTEVGSPGLYIVYEELTVGYPLPTTIINWPHKHNTQVQNSVSSPSAQTHDFHQDEIDGYGDQPNHTLHNHQYSDYYDSSIHKKSLNMNYKLENSSFLDAIENYNYNDNFQKKMKRFLDGKDYKNKNTRYQRHIKERLDFQREIESLLDMRGVNGSACVQRARCEALQLLSGHAPSLLETLMRLLFLNPINGTSSTNKAEILKECDAGRSCPFSLLEADLPLF